LIELLVVIVIILLLMTLIVGLAPYLRRAMLVAKCRAEIEHIHFALQEHKMQQGGYPGIVGGETNATELASTAVTNWMPKGVDFVDPWRTPYTLNIASNGTMYTLFSYGPDRLHGTERQNADDIETGR
jgi:type II secretory pathway pseudopilin PulG